VARLETFPSHLLEQIDRSRSTTPKINNINVEATKQSNLDKDVKERVLRRACFLCHLPGGPVRLHLQQMDSREERTFVGMELLLRALRHGEDPVLPIHTARLLCV
jgi:hypothetical protein